MVIAKLIQSVLPLFSLTVLGLLLHLCGYGFDITDEGFYLVTIQSPKDHSTTSQFGSVLNPLWHISSLDIARFRQYNFLILFFSAWSLFLLILRNNSTENTLANATNISSILSLTVFSYLIIWLPTPNYNSLNLIALIIASIGLILITHDNKKLRGYVLVGISGYLCFMAKPTSAIALSFFVLAWLTYKLILTKGSKALLVKGGVLSAIIAITLVTLHAITIAGSTIGFIENIQQGMVNGKTLLGSNWANTSSLFWKGQLEVKNTPLWITAYLLMITLCSVFLLTSLNYYRKGTAIFIYGTAGAILLTTLLTLSDKTNNPLLQITTGEHFLLTWGTILILVIPLIASSILKKQHSNTMQSLFFLLMPYAYIVGTSNNYFTIASQVPIFGVAAILTLRNSLKKRQHPLLIAITSSCTISMTLLSLHASLENPYRQTIMPKIYELRSNNGLQTISNGRLKNLKLTNNIANYLNTLTDQAQQNGFKEGTPIIDLTGASPGTLFALGGKNLGAAWLLGGYKGSDAYAIAVLKKASQAERDSAWLLIEENWKRNLSESVLRSMGKSLSDYTLVTTVIIPNGLGGRTNNNVQKLYKPNL